MGRSLEDGQENGNTEGKEKVGNDCGNLRKMWEARTFKWGIIEQNYHTVFNSSYFMLLSSFHYYNKDGTGHAYNFTYFELFSQTKLPEVGKVFNRYGYFQIS